MGRARGLPAIGLGVAFFLSGATALAAEVVLNRLLTYVFGSSHAATATVLAAYMAGLSLGAAGFGHLATRFRRPVRVYAVLELCVALFLALLPAVYPWFRDLALAVVGGLGAQGSLATVVRFVLAFVFVLVPTVLMGGTLPVLLAAFGGGDTLERRLPWLYAVNTLGAAAGTLLSAYLGIERLGLDGVAAAAAGVDVLAAVAALLLAPRLEGAGAGEAAAPPPGPRAWLSRRLALALAFGQGAVSFTLEVVWAHLVRTVIGVTVYAFAVMLAAILVGIGLGSLLAEAAGRGRVRRSLGALAWSQAALATVVGLTLPLWDRFPDLINLTLRWRAEWGFAEREAVRFAFALVLMLPATLPLGLALPSLAAARDPGDPLAPATWVGRVFAANTLGAIAGSLFCGFVLLGRVGSPHILAGAALAAAGLCAATVRWAQGRGGPSWRPVGLALAAAAAAGLFPGWDLQRLTAGTHYQWTRWVPPPDASSLAFFAEDAQSGFVTVHRQPDGTRVIRTNGKYEGWDGVQEFQDYPALLGGLYAPGRGRAVLVGLGPGRTLALLHEMGFGSLEVVDFSPAIIEAARREYPHLVAAPFADPAVSVHCDDGRNHIQLSPHRYDLVAVGITGAAFAGAGNLYSRDFFEAVRGRLAPGGVFVLWLQLHHVPPREVASVLGTLRAVYPHVHVYASLPSDQGFLVASPWPLAVRTAVADAMTGRPRAGRSLAATRMRSGRELTALCALTGDDEMASVLAAGPPPVLLTDLRPSFEYATPRGLALTLPGFAFAPHSAGRLPEFSPPLPAGEAAGLRGLLLSVLGRAPEALAELEASERLLGEQRWPDPVARLRRVLGRP